jgi:hypothetical protein
MVTASDLNREALEMAESHGPHRGRPCPALARMPALRRGALVTLAFIVMVPLFAGVTYDQTVKRGSFDGALPVKSRVPSLDPPVFDIPLTMYAPPLESARPETFKIVLQGDRLVRIGKDYSTIFDLQARTITILRPNSHSYSIEAIDEVQKCVSALFHRWNSRSAPTYTAAIQKTGQTRQIEGQTAEEYRLIAISMRQRRVGGSSIYWIIPKSPSDELANFQARWSRECGLAFPGMPTTPAGGDTSLFGVMAQGASTLPGYPVLYIVESRPLPGAERLEVDEGLGSSDPSSRQPAHPSVSQAMVPADLTNIRVSETAFSGFVDGAVDPLVFEVPAGYKKTKSFRYMPD